MNKENFMIGPHFFSFYDESTVVGKPARRRQANVDRLPLRVQWPRILNFAID
jgi:hypothetical protein